MDGDWYWTVGARQEYEQWANARDKEDDMAKIGEMIESKYLKQSDIDDEVKVTIEKVGKGNIAKEGDEPEHKWMVKFREFKKPMILNSTNIKRLAKACQSEDSDDWSGKTAILYVDPDIEFAGNVVGGLRIRAMRNKAAETAPAGEMDDSVPF